MTETAATEVIEPSPEPIPDLSATPEDWVLLRQAVRVRLWKLLALTLGLKPRGQMTAALRAAGRDADVIKLAARRSVAVSNLSELPIDGGLHYEKVENDGRAYNASKPPSERVVDVVKFVAFMQSRGFDLPDAMLQVATAVQAERAVGQAVSVQIEATPARPIRKSPDRNTELVLGLMMELVRDLAAADSKVGTGYLKGCDRRLNVSFLSGKLSERAERRTDVDGRKAVFGLSDENIRKVLANAASRFTDDLRVVEEVNETDAHDQHAGANAQLAARLIASRVVQSEAAA